MFQTVSLRFKFKSKTCLIGLFPELKNKQLWSVTFPDLYAYVISIKTNPISCQSIVRYVETIQE